MYEMVPTTRPGEVTSSGDVSRRAAALEGTSILARPKSSTFTRPRLVWMRFAALDVAMDDVVRMRLLERVRELGHDVHGIPHGQRPSGNAVREVLALHVLHRDEQRPLVLGHVVGDGDVRRAQDRCGACLGINRARLSSSRRVSAGRNFERHFAPEAGVLGKVYLAHAAAAEAPHDAIVENRFPFDHFLHCRHEGPRITTAV